MRDKHKGETCVVIANGPSLADVPNEFLEPYITFGVNKIWLKEFSPTYYVTTDNWMNPYIREMKDSSNYRADVLPTARRGKGD